VVESFDLAVVGGGIVGLAIARQLSRQRDGASIVVFEKEPTVATHQTGHNSGVVHAGVYYPPHSLKASLCREGADELRNYCRERLIPFDERGKLVVARNDREVEGLTSLFTNARTNGVPGVEWLESREVTELEPGVTGRAAFLSPTTGIVDFAQVARAFCADVTALGGQVLTSTEVTRMRRTRHGVQVLAGQRVFHVGRLVVCGGLHSDRLADMVGAARDPRIVPFRGEYLRLKSEVGQRVHRLIYPVPDPTYPFLGVHLTPRINGEVDLGPNAVLALSREGYRRRDVSLRDVGELLAAPSMRRLARAHWRVGGNELRSSLSRRRFVAQAQTYLPWLRTDHLVSAPAGVRAQAVDSDGRLVDDFRITIGDGVVLLRNAPSPAATASLAIASHVVDQMFPTRR